MYAEALERSLNLVLEPGCTILLFEKQAIMLSMFWGIIHAKIQEINFMRIVCQQRPVGSKSKFVSINLLTDEGILLKYTGGMLIER